MTRCRVLLALLCLGCWTGSAHAQTKVEQSVTVHPLLLTMSMSGSGRLYVGGGVELTQPQSLASPNAEVWVGRGGAKQIQVGAVWMDSRIRRGAPGLYAGGGVGAFLFPSSASTIFLDARLGAEIPISRSGFRAEARVYLPTPMLAIGLGLRLR